MSSHNFDNRSHVSRDLHDSQVVGPAEKTETYNSYMQGSQRYRRGFMGTQRHYNYNTSQINSASMSHHNNRINDSMVSEFDQSVSIGFIGPNLSVVELEAKVRSFIRTFNPREARDDDPGDEPHLSYYMRRLRQVKETDQYFLVINAQHILEFQELFYWQLVVFPAEIILNLDKILTDMYKESFLSDQERVLFDRSIISQVVNLSEVSNVRDLKPDDINRLISIRGIVIRSSDIYPDMREATFRCSTCGFKKESAISQGRVDEPTVCTRCQTRYSFQLEHNMCTFTDKQYVKLQETPEQVPEGETPVHVNLILYDDVVDSCRPGDSVEFIGIYRAQPMRVSRNKRVLHSIFRNYVDVVSVSFLQQNKIAVDSENLHDSDKILFSEAEVREFRQFAQRPDYLPKLLEYFAGSLWEMDDVKKGLLCQLFGGTPKDFDESFKGKFRHDLNVLLIGDPSTAKSQLLQCVNKVSPRGIYTSGKGSSAVGLTAYISRDPETKEIILESGALVLSDRGICCIDEFDKMNDNTKSILHEVMEQQTISIAKAGVVCSLNARTAVLAAANPKESKYNPLRSIVYNIMLPPALLSRFDLIYLMLDKVNEAQDKLLASHILELFLPLSLGTSSGKSNKFDRQKFLGRYIAYARQYCKPVLSDACDHFLVSSYLELRGQGASKNVITATPRQLESMIRISESLAKMRLSDVVEENDIMEAARLIHVATQQSAMDPVTGQIDMNLISTGYSSSVKAKIKIIADTIEKMMVR